MTANNVTNQISAIKKQLQNGEIEPDECFCLCLSLLGHTQLLTSFDSLFIDLRSQNPKLHKRLQDVHETYYAQAQLDENPIIVSKFSDEEEALSYALKVSLEQNGPSWATVANDSDTKTATASQFHATTRPNTKPFSKAGYEGTKQLSNVYQFKFKNPSCEKSTVAQKIGKQVDQSYPKKDPVALGLGSNFGQQVTNQPSLPPGLHISQTCEEVPKKGKNRKKKKHYNLAASQIDRPLVSQPIIYWLRRDLRLYDNPALFSALQSNGPIVPVFIWSEKEEGPSSFVAAGGATKYWLHFALKELNQDFQEKLGSRILFYKTDEVKSQLSYLVNHVNAGKIVWTNLYEPFLKSRDDDINRSFSKKGILVERVDSYLLYPPETVNMEQIGLLGIGSVTHFMESCRQSKMKPVGQPLDVPGILPVPSEWPQSQLLDDLRLAKLPKRKDGTVIDWAAYIRKSWNFSENGAFEALESFFGGQAVRNYEKESARCDQLNTCRVSPYLHFGQISPRVVLRYAEGQRCPKFRRKLAWRDLSYFVLHLFPESPTKSIRPPYEHQRWSREHEHLKSWQKGQTGYPLVDAAMRQLWSEGWVNNYMRHVTASFLISYLHFSWVEGYRWYQDTLLDADVAIDAMMWQNGGMSGLDHWNFVMHPVDAAYTCDPEGTFVKKWCPELKGLPAEHVHTPWKCPPSMLRRAGVQLGVNYPNRIITALDEAREQSLNDVVTLRLKFGKQYVDSHTGNDLVPLPGKNVIIPVITRREFKYRTRDPAAKDNPHNAVLRGYRSRKRDEIIAFEKKVDFTASTMNESIMRREREEERIQAFDMY